MAFLAVGHNELFKRRVQCLGLPQAGFFLGGGFHAAPFNHQRNTKKNPMLSNMLIRVLRV